MKTYIAFIAISLLLTTNATQAQQTGDQIQSPPESTQGWYKQNSGSATANLTGVFFTSHDTGWISSASGFILHTVDAGQHWDQLTAPEGLCNIVPSDEKIGIASTCSSSSLYYTNDGWQTWLVRKVDSITTASILGLSFPSPSIAYGITNRAIIKSEDGGLTWNAYHIGWSGSDLAYLNAIHYLDTINGILAGGGIILRMYGTGQVFQRNDALYGAAIFYGCQLVTQQLEFAVGEINKSPGPGIIVRTTDGGKTWGRTIYPDSLTGAAFTSVSFSDSLNGTVVGYNGLILRSTNGGDTWAKQESGVVTDLNAVFFTDSLTGTAVGVNGIILHTMNGGYSWVNPTQHDSLAVQTFPNPVEQSLNFHYSLPLPQNVSLSLYDVAGHSVGIILNNSFQTEGDHIIPLNASLFPNETYYYKFESEKYSSSGHFTVIH
ncbi:MAG: YCF48-related protein [Bacteroidota bacterium]|nr:YCF48-related protein [Bacteroidota bacterium]MDP4231496.1 YCF48-related protein [Bacteroidota bacterium]MDP4235704.1 YCF48-related protein [Bacteroidota bacterium]